MIVIIASTKNKNENNNTDNKKSKNNNITVVGILYAILVISSRNIIYNKRFVNLQEQHLVQLERLTKENQQLLYKLKTKAMQAMREGSRVLNPEP